MISVQSISKTFNPGSVNENRAIRKLSIDIAEGEFVTLIGSNGAGKSTLLNLIAGVFPLDTGRILLGERNVTRWKEHQRARYIGRVFQDPMMGTCASMSIEENLSLAMKRDGRRGFGFGVRNSYRELFRRELATLGLGLEDRLGDPIGLLSGGQRQSITLLMASIVKPEILLLDEHTAALDPRTAQTVMNVTRSIVEEHQLTTLMITHNMEHALQYGNRLVMLHKGEVVLDIKGPEREGLQVPDLLRKFSEVRGEQLSDDALLLR